MSLEPALVSYLKAYAGLTALVSTRIYPIAFPDGVTMPCVTYQRIDTPYTHTMQTSGATGTLTRPRFQFDVYGETVLAVSNIQDQLRAALNGKTGSVGTSPNTATIRASLAQNETIQNEPTLRLFRGISEFFIWYEE